MERAASRFVQILTGKLEQSVIDTLSKRKNRQLAKFVFENDLNRIRSVAGSMYSELKQ